MEARYQMEHHAQAMQGIDISQQRPATPNQTDNERFGMVERVKLMNNPTIGVPDILLHSHYPMHSFISAISFLIIYLFPPTIAKEPVKLVEDDEFLAFVKNPSNFWQCKTLKKRDELEYRINRVTYGFKQMREHLVHKYEAHLGVLYLMRQCWDCAKIVEQIKGEYERTECHKFRKYLDILYEYLFRVHIEGRGVDSMLAQHFCAVKPNFKLDQRGETIENGTLFAYADKFGIFNSSPFIRSIILLNDLDLLLALFNDPPTFYEVLKMAKILGEMDDDFHILLNTSNLKRIFKRLNREEESIEKIEIKIKNEFCALANFVGDLLEKANAEEVLKVEPIKVYIDNFVEKKELCKGKQKQKKIKKSLDGKDLYNGKTPKSNFNPINDLKQIIPAIVDEIEQMLQNGDWNYANLTYIKLDEWILLKYDLFKMGNDQKWKVIEQLLIEWEKAFSNWWSYNKSEENRPNFEEMMANLIKILRDFIIQPIVIEIVEESEQISN
uniref:Uncharacterized protein n=1 Tax=Globodera rostochiensis TaxID=31243 RepID=A0A914H4R8_GLORO